MTNQTWSPSKACADFVADLQYADIPAAVIDTMKRDTLDLDRLRCRRCCRSLFPTDQSRS